MSVYVSARQGLLSLDEEEQLQNTLYVKESSSAPAPEESSDSEPGDDS